MNSLALLMLYVYDFLQPISLQIVSKLVILVGINPADKVMLEAGR
jgi:hypothetical protein